MNLYYFELLIDKEVQTWMVKGSELETVSPGANICSKKEDFSLKLVLELDKSIPFISN